MTDINSATAIALLDEGLGIIPTAGGANKRPLANWKEYQSRLPRRDEVESWFASPRPGGIVCGAVCGNLEVLDLDTPEAFAAFAAKFGGKVPCERSPHGGHAWYRCDEIGRNSRPAEKVDTRGEGGFCVCYEPDVLLKAGVPRISRELREKMFAFVGGEAAAEAPAARPEREGSIWATLQAAGWKAGPERNGWVPIQNGTKTAAISADGANIKVFSTSIWEAPPPEPAAAPVVTPGAELVAANPEMPEAVLPFCRRGSIALLSAAPKAGKTVLAVRTALKAVSAGRRVLYADLENGACLFAHRLAQYAAGQPLDGFFYLDCTENPDIGYIAAGVEAAGGVDLLVIDPWGLLIANSGVEDESSNALVSMYFLKMRRILKPFNCATLILHHLPKSGVDQPLAFAGAGASALMRYVQTIARIREDKSGIFWFEALCREFDQPFKPVIVRSAGG